MTEYEPHPHKIANSGIAVFEPHGLIRIFFPNLTDSARNEVDEAHVAQFYDLVLRPAVTEVLAQSSPEWPAEYWIMSAASKTRSGRSVGGK